MTRLSISTVVLVLSIVCPSPLAAQTRPAPPRRPPDRYPAFAPRAFVMFGQQQFTAKDTFEAIFGESTGSFRGGGVDLVLARSIFLEVGIARFEQTGERVFRNGGETFRLGIPLRVSIRPIETVAGYRLTAWRSIVPYGGVGYGSYRYKESSDFSAAGDDVSVSASGLVLVGGVEVRVARFVGVSVDVHHSRIEEIIGGGGISQEFGENDLGGTSARFRIIIGR